MALPALPHRPTTPEAYLEWEEAQTERHEFYQGEVFAMAGGTFGHSLLASNVMRALGNALSGRGCHVLTGDMRILVQKSGLYTYPDASVVCGTPEFLTDRETTLLNPSLIVEVLSVESESYDRGAKFRLYRELESLQEYVLVSQRARAVDVFHRDAEGWRLVSPDADGHFDLPSVGATLTLDAIYAGLDVPDREPLPDLPREDEP